METLEDLKKRTLVYVPADRQVGDVYHWRAGRPRYTLCGIEVVPADLVLKPLGEVVIEECIHCKEVTKRIEKGWS